MAHRSPHPAHISHAKSSRRRAQGARARTLNPQEPQSREKEGELALREVCFEPRRRFTVPQIDMLRVIAMFGIFIHHLWGGRHGHGAFESILAFVCDIGQFGVVFFNFMTGFVLALPYLGYECRPVPSYSRFLQRRFLRIVPAYYLALVLFAGLNLLVFSPLGAASALRWLGQHLLFLQGFDASILASNTAAYWYLSLLAQFYLVFPLLLHLFLRFGAGTACLLVCGLCWGGLGIWTLALADPTTAMESAGIMVYFNLPARLPELAIGMWLAAAWQPGTSPSHGPPVDSTFLRFALGMLALGGLAAPWARELVLPFSLIFEVSWCVVCFVVLFLRPSVSQLGMKKAIKSVSLASYGIYLVHQPIFSYWGHWLGDPLSPLAWFLVSFSVLGPLTYGLGSRLEPAAAYIVSFPSKLRNARV